MSGGVFGGNCEPHCPEWESASKRHPAITLLLALHMPGSLCCPWARGTSASRTRESPGHWLLALSLATRQEALHCVDLEDNQHLREISY